MEAELLAELEHLLPETQKKICLALNAQCQKNTYGYKTAIQDMPEDGIKWLIQFHSSLLENRIK